MEQMEVQLLETFPEAQQRLEFVTGWKLVVWKVQEQEEQVASKFGPSVPTVADCLDRPARLCDCFLASGSVLDRCFLDET